MERSPLNILATKVRRVDSARTRASSVIASLGTEVGPSRLSLEGELPANERLHRIAEISAIRYHYEKATQPILESFRSTYDRDLTEYVGLPEKEAEFEALQNQRLDLRETAIFTINESDPEVAAIGAKGEEIVKIKAAVYRRRKINRTSRGLDYTLETREIYAVPLPNGNEVRITNPLGAYVLDHLLQNGQANHSQLVYEMFGYRGNRTNARVSEVYRKSLTTEFNGTGFRVRRFRDLAIGNAQGVSTTNYALERTEDEQLSANASFEENKPAISQKSEPNGIEREFYETIRTAARDILAIRALKERGAVDDETNRIAEEEYSYFISTRPLGLAVDAVADVLVEQGKIISSERRELLNVLKNATVDHPIRSDEIAKARYGNSDGESIYKANGYMFTVSSRLHLNNLGIDVKSVLEGDSMTKGKWTALRRHRPTTTFSAPHTYYIVFKPTIDTVDTRELRQPA